MKLSNLIPILKEETFTATNKATGKTSVFKSKDSRDAAIKAGTHAAIKTSNDAPTASVVGTSVFGGDSASKKQPSASLNADKNNRMSSKSVESVQNILNKKLGVDGFAQTNREGAIEYIVADKNGNYSSDVALYIGKDKDGYNVSIESDGDKNFGDDWHASFDNPKDAMDHAVKLATKYKKELSKEVKPTNKKIGNQVFSKSNPFKSGDIYNQIDLSWKDGYTVSNTLDGIKIEKTKPGKRQVDYSYQIKQDKDTGEAVIIDNKNKTIIGRAKSADDVFNMVDKIKKTVR